MSRKCKPIIIVAGDPKSIFLEIFFKVFNKKKKLPIILIVNKKILISQLKLFKKNFKLNELKSIEILKTKILKKNVINFINVKFNSKNSNKYIADCFSCALSLLKKNQNNIRLINGPIVKKTFLKSRFNGITEYLASKSKKKNKVAMLIFNRKLSVSPITTHIPLKNVHKDISKNKIINHVKLISTFYKKNLKIVPKIGITGLNPHCESNFDSSEEDKIITPAITYLKNKKYKVSGPFPADTIFLKKNRNNFNVIVGMYHDQVLSPLKTLYEYDAINITLGLSFIRISPDHGPNEKMLGKNLSNPLSLIKAIKFLDKN